MPFGGCQQAKDSTSGQRGPSEWPKPMPTAVYLSKRETVLVLTQPGAAVDIMAVIIDPPLGAFMPQMRKRKISRGASFAQMVLDKLNIICR